MSTSNVYGAQHEYLKLHIGEKFDRNAMIEALVAQGFKKSSIFPAECMPSKGARSVRSCDECEAAGGFAVNKAGIIVMGADGFESSEPYVKTAIKAGTYTPNTGARGPRDTTVTAPDAEVVAIQRKHAEAAKAEIEAHTQAAKVKANQAAMVAAAMALPEGNPIRAAVLDAVATANALEVA